MPTPEAVLHIPSAGVQIPPLHVDWVLVDTPSVFYSFQWHFELRRHSSHFKVIHIHHYLPLATIAFSHPAACIAVLRSCPAGMCPSRSVVSANTEFVRPSAPKPENTRQCPTPTGSLHFGQFHCSSIAPSIGPKWTVAKGPIGKQPKAMGQNKSELNSVSDIQQSNPSH